ncbi:hypothetical protein GDO81_025831 [Engystomops pustulosus]|uniref:Uncharacterized protein n=1 Tax=Engystomops pustulosus TaxID=76066 RepID=A0AAV6YSG7_ENGPU|nr:hypothetical protein GDO81_025831 [Engystomops pustulosus]
MTSLHVQDIPSGAEPCKMNPSPVDQRPWTPLRFYTITSMVAAIVQAIAARREVEVTQSRTRGASADYWGWRADELALKSGNYFYYLEQFCTKVLDKAKEQEGPLGKPCCPTHSDYR